jgi:hypothetical protein
MPPAGEGRLREVFQAAPGQAVARRPVDLGRRYVTSSPLRRVASMHHARTSLQSSGR